jgi:hypothetical protein
MPPARAAAARSIRNAVANEARAASQTRKLIAQAAEFWYFMIQAFAVFATGRVFVTSGRLKAGQLFVHTF